MPKYFSKIRRAPEFLKEISPQTYGASQGDYAEEWDYAQFPSGFGKEDWQRAHDDPSSNFLGWWQRNGRSVYYFGDHEFYERGYEKEWDVYNWYRKEAERLNKAIDYYNNLPGVRIGIDFSYAKTHPGQLEYSYYPSIVIGSPRDIRNAYGIKYWLEAKANEVKNAFNAYDATVSEYNKMVRDTADKRMQLEAERKRKAEEEKEGKETKRFYELKGAIDDTDRRLTANINQLREDFFGAIKKQGDLFSELSSVREKDNTDTIAQFNEALMESSKVNISLQGDISKLNNETRDHLRRLQNLRKDFREFSNLYEVSEKKLKLNESSLKDIRKQQDKTEESLTGIQKKLDDNSAMFASEKEGLIREIEAIRKNASKDAQHGFAILNSKLETLTKEHDAVKTDLLSRLKKQQINNRTRFEELNAENKARGIQYDKDMEQLRRDLDVTRNEAMQASDALQEQEQRHKKQERRNKAHFKVLYDYQTNVDRQIKIQEKKTMNFAQLKRTRAMPDKAKALRNFRRGRYALLDEFV